MCRKNPQSKSFSRLTVISLIEERGISGALHWNCLCDCGQSLTLIGWSLVTGNATSCGCAEHDAARKIIFSVCGFFNYNQDVSNILFDNNMNGNVAHQVHPMH